MTRASHNPLAEAQGRDFRRSPAKCTRSCPAESGRPMNQTGLLIALAIAVVAGLAFGLYPQLDLDLVSPFYDRATGWAVGGRGWLLVRNTASWLIALIAAPAAIALLGK